MEEEREDPKTPLGPMDSVKFHLRKAKFRYSYRMSMAARVEG